VVPSFQKGLARHSFSDGGQLLNNQPTPKPLKIYDLGGFCFFRNVIPSAHGNAR